MLSTPWPYYPRITQSCGFTSTTLTFVCVLWHGTICETTTTFEVYTTFLHIVVAISETHVNKAKFIGIVTIQYCANCFVHNFVKDGNSQYLCCQSNDDDDNLFLANSKIHWLYTKLKLRPRSH